ncbi:SPOR domain-containing protein [Streptomyces sp. DSM 44917]|uniref:SPOR domain-containing protein n=1 Tax=Streptomyces boetiae TaxID=3075541 RepID=A0ABU2L832_9ACTN|nr:SPOR domain-containing protein [Streptomyces sp. DSM 44917]MDT0307731.1 SPOR domain-containing protein [Streptomyces sp. DSM 44917]
MNSSSLQPWQVVREDENGSRYRIGHCATRAEAQRLIQRLLRGAAGSADEGARYVVERVEPQSGARRH